jgi:hypothetical protein
MNKIVKDIDAGDTARFRPRLRAGRLAFDRGSHGHRKTCLQGVIYILRLGRPLQRKVNKA